MFKVYRELFKGQYHNQYCFVSVTKLKRIQDWIIFWLNRQCRFGQTGIEDLKHILGLIIFFHFPDGLKLVIFIISILFMATELILFLF
jgi:hypothetical protein